MLASLWNRQRAARSRMITNQLVTATPGALLAARIEPGRFSGLYNGLANSDVRSFFADQGPLVKLDSPPRSEDT
jgi:hypothetical protein